MPPQPIDFTPLESMGKMQVEGRQFNLNTVQILLWAPGFAILYFDHKNISPLFFIGTILVVAGFIFGWIESGKNKKIWQNFASLNSWQILPSKAGLSTIPPSVTGIGHSHKSSEVISGNSQGHNFTLNTYSYVTGYGKYAQRHDTTIMAIKTPVAAVHMLLVHKGLLSDAVKPFENSRKLALEGNFNKSFDLYIPNGGEIDSLQIITPDIMISLIKDDRKYNVEFVNNWVYFCVYEDERSPDNLKNFFGNTFATISALEQNYRLSHTPGVSPAAKPATIQSTPQIQTLPN